MKTDLQDIKTVPVPFSTVEFEAINLVAARHGKKPGDLIRSLVLATLPQQIEDL